LRIKLVQAINELTPEHRAVIVLRTVEGLSYKDIGEMLGCSEGTVMSRLHYARKKLQEKLRAWL
jgi:RNA polymerase sigma-70 factor (ECF subfamily)